MLEPRLSAELEDSTDISEATYGKILRELAGQLGVFNDYYMPLMDVAHSLDGKNSRSK